MPNSRALQVLAAAFVTTAACNPTRSYRVPTASMYPTIFPGESILVNVHARQPGRGDVVVFRARESGQDYASRVIGLPGDHVRVSQHRVELNGRTLSRCILGPDPGPSGAPGGSPGKIVLEQLEQRRYLVYETFDDSLAAGGTYCVATACTVPTGSLFLLGDSRDNSFDSRFRGFIPLGEVQGSATRIAGTSPIEQRSGHALDGDPWVPGRLHGSFEACGR